MNRIWNRKSHIFGSNIPGAKVRSTQKKDDHDSYYYKPHKNHWFRILCTIHISDSRKCIIIPFHNVGGDIWPMLGFLNYKTQSSDWISNKILLSLLNSGSSSYLTSFFCGNFIKRCRYIFYECFGVKYIPIWWCWHTGSF